MTECFKLLLLFRLIVLDLDPNCLILQMVFPILMSSADNLSILQTLLTQIRPDRRLGQFWIHTVDTLMVFLIFKKKVAGI